MHPLHRPLSRRWPAPPLVLCLALFASVPAATEEPPVAPGGPPPVDLGDARPAGGEGPPAAAGEQKFPVPGAPPSLSEVLPPPEELPPGALPPPPVPTSQNVTINLINRLVQRGVLTKEDAADLLQLAEADAAAAVVQQEAAFEYAELVGGGGGGEMRVAYIPEVVRVQMRDEIKAEMMAQAREEAWADSKRLPDWITKMEVFGDVRVRGEGNLFPGGSDNTGAFPNFNAINTGAPFDTAGTQFSPQINVDEDRYAMRVRARVGAEIMIGDGFTTGLRVATGQSNSPVSPNQSLGLASQAQGGNFSKYAIWLDRAFISYHTNVFENISLTADFGRFDNPFFGTELGWDDDLGFDGFATRANWKFRDNVKGFFSGGLFPVFSTDFNFASNQPSKFESTDKWLFGGQFGIEWKIDDDLTAKFAAAYYHFDGVQGKRSSPFVPLTISDAGDTDNTRPSFAQKGNTYFPLRNILPSPANDFGTKYQYQYYGLASEFRELALTGRLDYDGFDPFRLTVLGEYIQNLGFDKTEVAGMAVNNFNGNGSYDGGNQAAGLTVLFGKPALEDTGDWTAWIGYRYVESDAVLDGLNDSDFGLGGTNLQGFTIGGHVAINPSTRFGMRWLSADEIAGPAYRSDVFMIDLQTSF